MIVKHRKFTEDDFDLEEHRIKQERFVWFNNISRKSKKIVGILRIVIALLAFAIALLVYKAASVQLEIWNNNRINETARAINAQSPPQNESDRFEAQPDELSAEANLQPGDIIPSYSEINPNPADHETRAQAATLPVILSLRGQFANEEIVGYIKIKGTDMDFPVAQSVDNEFYLSHNLKKESSAVGAAFLDFENNTSLTDLNTVIYAHNMRDGSMFAGLKNYRDQSFYQQHSEISLAVGGCDSLWLVFACYETGADFSYNRVHFDSPADYQTVLYEIKARALYDTGLDIQPDDQILTLSTCAANDTRNVVHAKRVK